MISITAVWVSTLAGVALGYKGASWWWLLLVAMGPFIYSALKKYDYIMPLITSNQVGRVNSLFLGFYGIGVAIASFLYFVGFCLRKIVGLVF